MHALSARAIHRAAKDLAEIRDERLTTRISHGKYAEIVDDNGDIVHWGTNPQNMTRRIRNSISLKELLEHIAS